MSTAERPSLSVVIPTHNRAAKLERCVRSVIAEAVPSMEIVVSDDGSTDQTGEVLTRLTAEFPALRHVRGAQSGPAAARNRGWRAARGEVIAFVDDDCVVEPGWCGAIQGALTREPGWAGVEGKTRPEREERGFFFHTIDSRPAAYLTCNLGVRRAALEQVGGLDEGFPWPHCEDIDLCLRIIERVGPIGFAADARVIHEVVPVPPRYFLRRARQDPSTFRLFAKHPRYLSQALQTVRLPESVKALAASSPGFGSILLYVLTAKLMHAGAAIRRGESVRDRVWGGALLLGSFALTFAGVREELEAYLEARATEQPR